MFVPKIPSINNKPPAGTNKIPMPTQEYSFKIPKLVTAIANKIVNTTGGGGAFSSKSPEKPETSSQNPSPSALPPRHKAPTYTVEGNGPGGMWPAGQENIKIKEPLQTSSQDLKRAEDRSWFAYRKQEASLSSLSVPELLERLTTADTPTSSSQPPQPLKQSLIARMQNLGKGGDKDLNEAKNVDAFIGVTTDERIRTSNGSLQYNYRDSLRAQKTFLTKKLNVLEAAERVENARPVKDMGKLTMIGREIVDTQWRASIIDKGLADPSLNNSVMFGFNDTPHPLIKAIYAIHPDAINSPLSTDGDIVSVRDLSPNHTLRTFKLMDGAWYEVIDSKAQPGTQLIVLPAAPVTDGNYKSLQGPRVQKSSGNDYIVGPMIGDIPA